MWAAWIMMSWFVASQIIRFNKMTVIMAFILSALILSFLRIDWAIVLLVFLCPFHYVLKEMYPSIYTDIWREIFLACLLVSWFIQVIAKKLPAPSKNVLNNVIIGYLMWGILEIFRSVNLLIGLAGFRFMFPFIPLYFVALSVFETKEKIGKYVNAILISGFIAGIIGVIQFITVSLLHVVTPGSSIIFANKYVNMSSKLGLYRAVSVLASDNEFGALMVVGVLFLLVFIFYYPEYRKRHYKKAVFAILIMFAALLFSMSRSAMLGLGAGILAINVLKVRMKMILCTSFIVILLIMLLPFAAKGLFGPVFTLSDDYFLVTLNRHWDLFLQSPLWGHGFFITQSVADKLRISTAVNLVGGIDIDFFHIANQIGLIGFLLHSLIWFLFLKAAYLGAKSPILSDEYRAVSAAIFGILVAFKVMSLHLTVWDYVSIACTYYLLGAIATFIYIKSKEVLVEKA